MIRSGSRAVHEWFAARLAPSFAMFGHQSKLPMASFATLKSPQVAKALQRLVDLGQSRIVMMVLVRQEQAANGTQQRNHRLGHRNRYFDPNNDHFDPNNEHFDSNNDHFDSNNEHFDSSNEHFGSSNEHFYPSNDYFDASNEHFDPSNGKVSASIDGASVTVQVSNPNGIVSPSPRCNRG